MLTNTYQPRQPEPIDRRRLIISTTSSLLILVLCLFLPAGRWTWSRGWLFLIVVVRASIVDPLYLRSVNHDVIAGRVNRPEGPRRWDLLLGLIGFLPTMLAIPIVAGLDDDLAVTAPGSANDLGGPNPPGRIAWLQGICPGGSTPTGSWRLVRILK
jgi:hypothetical protein